MKILQYLNRIYELRYHRFRSQIMGGEDVIINGRKELIDHVDSFNPEVVRFKQGNILCHATRSMCYPYRPFWGKSPEMIIEKERSVK